MDSAQTSISLSFGLRLLNILEKEIVQRLEKISAAIEKCEGEREIPQTLGYLIERAGWHFSLEEQIMRENNFPGWRKHKIEHQKFNDTLNGLDKDMDEEGSTKALADAIRTFLAQGLIHHIRNVDRELGSFLQNRNPVKAGKSYN